MGIDWILHRHTMIIQNTRGFHCEPSHLYFICVLCSNPSLLIFIITLIYLMPTESGDISSLDLR